MGRGCYLFNKHIASTVSLAKCCKILIHLISSSQHSYFAGKWGTNCLIVCPKSHRLKQDSRPGHLNGDVCSPDLGCLPGPFSPGRTRENYMLSLGHVVASIQNLHWKTAKESLKRLPTSVLKAMRICFNKMNKTQNTKTMCKYTSALLNCTKKTELKEIMPRCLHWLLCGDGKTSDIFSRIFTLVFPSIVYLLSLKSETNTLTVCTGHIYSCGGGIVVDPFEPISVSRKIVLTGLLYTPHMCKWLCSNSYLH